jgi:hypothetical protein
MDSDRQIWRFIFLVLVLVAIAGPWAFDRINVPAQFPCSPPFIRLEGDFCGTPMRGITLLYWMLLEVVGVIWNFLTGELPLARLASRMLRLSFLFLLLLPLFTTLLLLKHQASRGLQRFHIITLLFVTGMGLWVVNVPASGFHPALWGMWVYFTLGFLMLIVELFSLRKADPIEGLHTLP